MDMATGEGSPLRQGAGTGLDWFSMATEASGGGTPDLGFFLEVLSYIRGVGVENKSGGLRAFHEVGRRPGGWAARDSSGPTLLLHGLLLVQK